jgi:hypothetical protein
MYTYEKSELVLALKMMMMMMMTEFHSQGDVLHHNI